MKSFKDILVELHACEEAKTWAGNKSIETVVKTCPRGDWLLWLGKRLELPLNKMTLAKARCVKTVIHLMEDERSINAVNIAERFGLDECGLKELDAAAFAASAAYAYGANARKQNQKKTAEICREILGDLIIEEVNKRRNYV